MRMRADCLARLRAGEVPEVVIVGGGINGVGVFRDLALQGVPALLVEAEDFASGTSAAPSRLIHGGLRYLETGEMALVKESLTERNRLLKNASHVVHPLACWVPLRSWFGGAVTALARFLRLTRTPGAKGAVPVKLGMLLYDRFGRTERTMPDHSMIAAENARNQVPALASDIRVVAQYYDAIVTHPERLVVELIGDAEADCPAATALSYLKAVGLENGRLVLRDEVDGETFEIAPKILVNAAGAWVDEVQAGLGFEDRLMGGTRGSHLVVRHAELADQLQDRMLYFETDDRRACLIYRMGGDRLFLGTTDIRSDDPGDKMCRDEEIDYLFEVLRPILPDIRLSRDDILFAVAGVRPLPRMEAGATGAISRDHRVDSFEPTAERPFPTLTLVGGKWTTYRALAEEVTDQILDSCGQKRHRSTQELAIGGAANLPARGEARQFWQQELAASSGLGAERIAQLVERYGLLASKIAQIESQEPGFLASASGYSRAEIDWLCRSERVERLDDIFLRRTLMGFEGHFGVALMTELADIASSALGWDAARRRSEIERTASLLQNRHRMTVDA